MVLNASSGHGTAPKVAERLKEIFAEAGREARITLAKGGTEISAAMRRAVEDGCEALVAGGGDGTINSGASAAVERGIPLGVLPLGTLNHFAKDLGIPLDLEEAAKVVLEGVVCKVDVGEVNGRIFLNNSSLGVYPAIVRLRERYQATVGGKWIAALWAGLTVLRRSPFMAVRIVAEGETIVRRTPLVLVGNNEYRMSGYPGGHPRVARPGPAGAVRAERGAAARAPAAGVAGLAQGSRARSRRWISSRWRRPRWRPDGAGCRWPPTAKCSPWSRRSAIGSGPEHCGSTCRRRPRLAILTPPGPSSTRS